MRIPRGFSQMHFLHLPEKRADAGCLDTFKLARDLRVERVFAQAGHEGRLVEPDHFVQFLLCRLVPARKEDLAIERRLRGPDSKERFQIDDVDLTLYELPHESVRLRCRRDGLKEVGIVDSRNPILPGRPLGDDRGPLTETHQRLRVDGPLKLPENVIEVRSLDELPEEFDGETARRHKIFLDFLGRCPVDLRTNDGLDVLEVVAIQITAHDRSELALAEIVDVIIRLRQVLGRRHLDQVHTGVAGPEGEHLGLVLALPEEPGDFGDFHLQDSRVHLLRNQGGPSRTDTRRDVGIVACVVRNPFADPAVASEETFVLSFARGSSGHRSGGHSVSATSFTASSQTSRRSVSYRKSTRRVPSALSITTPPAHSTVPANESPTIFRTRASSRGLAYTLPPERHSASFALSSLRRMSALSESRLSRSSARS